MARRVRHLARIMGVAALITGLGLAANTAVSFLVRDLGNSPIRWIAPTVLALVVAMAQAAADATVGPPPGAVEPAGAHANGPGPGHRGTAMIVAVTVVVLVVGLGSLAVAQGVRFAVGWATGNERVESERLAQQTQATSGDLTATVMGVGETRHFTKVRLTVRNDGPYTTVLPLAFCRLTSEDGSVLKADPFRSDWSEEQAPGGTQASTLTFRGHLPAPPTSATLAFTVVSVQGPVSGGTSLVIEPIPLLPRDEAGTSDDGGGESPGGVPGAVRAGTAWNLREAPTMDSTVVGTIAGGTPVVVECIEDGWVRLTDPSAGTYVWQEGVELTGVPPPC